MASDIPTRTPNPIVAFLGIAAALVVIPVVLIWALCENRPFNQIEQRRAAQRIETRTKLEAEAMEKLSTAGWADKAKGTVHVPIAQAMTMVVAELSAKKPVSSAVKVEPPLPMPVIDPAATEPPPPALPSAPQGADTIRFALPATSPAPTPTAPAPAAPSPAAAAPAPAAPAPAIPPASNPTENSQPAK